MAPRIANSARRHGVSDMDMRHAYDNAIDAFDLDGGFVMLVGPDRAANLMEVGVVIGLAGPQIVHAMRPVRRKFTR